MLKLANNDGGNFMLLSSAEQMWSDYLAINSNKKSYKIMNFSGEKEISNSIVDSIYSGEKKGSTSLFEMFENKADIPKAGDYSVVTNFEDKAKCVVETEYTKVMKFSDMTKELAICESNVYKDLNMWEKVHREFFSFYLSGIDKVFSDDMIIVYHSFKRVY